MIDIIDSRDVTIDGITVRVIITPDADCSPAEFDCYSEADTAAFQAGAWQFVGMIVRHESTRIETSLWAIEWGDLPGAGGTHLDLDHYLSAPMIADYAGNMVRAEIIPTMHALRDALAELPLDGAVRA